MNSILVSIRYLVATTLLLGVIYPLVVTGIGKLISSYKAQGSLIEKNGKVIGSELLAQKFTKEEYFWPRPSAADYNPSSSAASNKSGTSQQLKDDFLARKKALGENAPVDLLYASGSGLDPHISVEAAHFQKARIMARRNLSEETLNRLINEASEERFLGFMGQPRVNVLKLNLALDKQ